MGTIELTTVPINTKFTYSGQYLKSYVISSSDLLNENLGM